ncbi:wall-associated receptor kinase 2 [Eucalyptus grandis]|uniref:wall-associated receptor kinase 2 n=1 Tax=Eucalyptus grandis TaxID=71139 RepID=UPI00192ECD78|nr:wall-associated receptor kinase 2 [Eucalyptus grandis]
MKIVRQLLLVAVAWWLRQGGAPTVAGHCAPRCGRVPIPYPFGLERGCVSSEEFLLHCSTTEGSGDRLLFRTDIKQIETPENYSIRRISVSDSTMVIRLPELNDCYNKSGSPLNTSYTSKNLDIDLSEYPQYRLSATRNALTVLGCDTYALTNVTAVVDKYDFSRGGCISYCNESVDLAKETTCSECLAIQPLWSGLRGDKESFNISSKRLPTFNDSGKSSDLVLDWMIGWDVNCTQAKSNPSSYGCGNNTDCRDFADAPGYRCFCQHGYEGNPYDLSRGCQDINECEDPQKYPCRGKCENLPGSYRCDCDGDNRRDIALAMILVPVVCIYASASASVTWKWRIRKINFKRNGGKFFKSQGVQIFTEAELAKATNNYDESNKLGEGSFGSVYKGRVAVDKGGSGSVNRGRIAMDIEVVVKKPKDVHKPLMKKEFQDELLTVMQTNHKNMVKLYGICLETRIPLLVYEYILSDTHFNTLFKHIHPKVSTFLRSWENRLKIATEATLALKEMHSSGIIHGNIKSANILIDQNYSVKISDFGTSVLKSLQHSHIVATEIEGTLDYIDPEYLTTGKLTIKSDVYNFGAVLMELLTGKKPTSFVANKSEEPINIIPHFISSVNDGTLFDVINFKATGEDEIKQVEMVAKIAVKCLDQSSRKRPTMSEVAQQLPPINQSLTVAENIEEPKFKVAGTICPTVEISVTDCLSCLGSD